MNRSALSAVALFALAFSAHDAFALPIPDHDYFNGITGGSELNTAPPGWTTTTTGTVDWIQRGNQWLIRCFDNSRGCVDLDGSTGKAGLMETVGTFQLAPGKTYELSAEVSGNQRGGASDNLTFGFLKGAAFLSGATETISSIAPNSPFTLYKLFYTNMSSTTLTVRAFFDDVGGADDVGPILDHVNINTVKPVPLPAAVWLLLSGIAGVGSMARRRKTAIPA